jgi:6-phosphogluconolactonase
MANVHICTDKNVLFSQAADLFVKLANEAITSRGRFCVALSGGSTPRGVHTLLASEAYRQTVAWQKVYCFWGDERCVAPTHKDSNYRMADETLLSQVPIPQENVHRIRAERDPAEAANCYEQTLRQVFGVHTGTQPQFDLVFLGMGADGHTASLFPGTPVLHAEDHLVTAHFVEKLDAWRVTLTAAMINNSAYIAFLVAGEDKAATLKAVVEGDGQPEQYPSQLIQPTHGRLLWLVDQAAAGQLSL